MIDVLRSFSLQEMKCIVFGGLPGFPQDECKLLLDLVGLGLGPKQLPYRGPGPPPVDWDGLSVAVWNVPRKTTLEEILVTWW